MDRPKELDWEDISLHAGIGTLVVVSLAWGSELGVPGAIPGAIAAAVVNTVGWPLREYLQSRTLPKEWSLQKHLEGWLPGIAGWAGLGGYLQFAT